MNIASNALKLIALGMIVGAIIGTLGNRYGELYQEHKVELAAWEAAQAAK